MSEPNPSAPGQPSAEAKAKNLGMAFASMGVVFGDIGTSPLYALREALAHATQDGQVLREDVLGVVSLLIWALILVVTLKYVVLLLRADNKGEGGILSLVTLVEQATGTKRGLVLLLGIIGAAFFFGDAMITPAISVLSAVEGLKVINPGFEQYVVPSTLAVLITLFAAQYKGTAGVASLFAPITTIWFITIGALGAYHIFDDLAILGAFNPIFGIHMLMKDPAIAILVLGGVFLAVTGGESLYADMGHFGKKPIRMAWTSVVLPALALNYLGQGALIYSDPSAGANPFFLMVPSWGIIPIVMLATMVTVIASQAVITGAFSIAQQAMNLGLFPRMSISHTSETEAGQIYVNQINWLLLVGVIMLVLTFQSSSNLASAYGIAVNT
jgi:KUP system potassium uptake protein